jgi:regulator of protease activity HflC (stomatin/prohibitin superfamily)
VEQAKVGIVEKFGKYERIAEPGFQCVNWICGRRLAGYISLRVQQLDVRCETKTKVSYNVHAVQHYVLVFVLHAYDLLQLCGLLSLRRGAFFLA